MNAPLHPNHLASLIEFSVFRRTTDSLDVLQFARIDAALQSARHYQERMLTAQALPDDLAHLRFALERAPADGQILEFGVASGRTLNHLAGLAAPRRVHGFDVFSGLPEAWRTGFDAGAFAQALPKVADNAELVVGLFDQTLPAFVAAHPEPIALLHVDCDLYSSTCTILEHCRGLLRPGSVVVFDEYFNYPGWQQHEHRAWREFTEAEGIAWRYLAFVPAHQQVSVVVE